MLTDYRHLPRWLVAIATCCAIVISMAVINPSAYAEEANATAITDSAAATNENKSTDTVTQDSTLSGRRASRASRAASKAPNLPIYDLDGTATHLNQEYANTYRVALIAPAGAYYLDQALDSALQLSKKKLYKDVRFFALDYDSDRSSFSKYASQETSNVRFASSADASNQDYYYFAWDSYQTFHPDSYQANLPFIVLIDKDNNLVGCETGSQSLSSLIEDYFHISDGSVKNSSVTGTYLGPGTTVYAVDTLQQSSIYQAALKKVTQWRQDALNDSRIRVRYYNPETGYEYYVSIADYLKASNISQEQYLSPGWSNSLEKIAIQRSIEAYDVDLAHTRPDGNSCFEATVGEDSSSGEILAWGGSDIASAIDLWASEKDDYVHFLNGESHGQYGHYEELINPEYQYYGFAGSSAAYYGTVFAGEASDSALGDSSPTNLDGTFTFEVNMSDEHMDQGVTWNAPDTMIAGTSKAASVKLKYANGRYELRGTWTSSNPSVISVDDNGTLHAKAPGTATITVNRQSYSFSKQITVTLSTISFSGNGATSGSMKSIQGAIGQSTTIPNVGFSRTGYTFTGWNTSPDGTGTAYRSNGTIQFAAQDITLYAQWKVRSYSVNFDSNGGSAVASQSVRYGFKASQPASPTRTGHTFQGWYTAQDGGTRYDFNRTVTGDITLYAHWAVNSYTLAFDGNGGKSSESSRTVTYGGQYGGLPTATRTGYTFQGWYTARDDGAKVSPSTTMGAADTTVYAHWTINTYTLTFDGNGGKANEASRTVAYGGQYGGLPTATRTGYTFQGWYTAKNGGSQVSSSTTMGAADTTVYAHWTIRSYTVAFDANGGSNVPTQKVRYGSKASRPADPTRAGHTFQGWYTARDGGSRYDFSRTVTGDVTLYAHWSVNSYTLTFDGNGGKASESSRTVQYGSSYGALPTAMRTGYTFQGWYTAKDGGSQVYMGTVMGAANTTVYAHWTVNTYTLTFNGNGGKASESSRTVQYGGQYGTLPTATRTGYTFQGWYTAKDGGSQVSASTTMGAADTTVYAHWTIRSYTVAFDANGGSAVASQTVKYGAKATQPANPTRTDYTFQGWYTAKDGGAKYDFNQTVTGNVTLYAHWTANTYTVSFDANGGSSVAAQKVKYGSRATKPADPTRTGYTFQGWYTAKDGGARYDFNQTVTGDVTLHAHWTKEPSALKRLAGATRYDTMEQIVETGGWKSGGTVIVASGGNYPDALAASGLAGTLDAPIVLTDAKTLSFQAFMTLTGLAPSKIIVAGGRAAVSDDVMNELEGICSHVERVAGATRVDTSLKLYQQGTGWSHTAILATAGNFADALSISSYAYAAKAPVFLVDSNGLTSKQQTALSNGQFSKIIVVGGVNAVPERVAAKAQSITGAQLTRLSGATRYETSERIARWATGHGLGMDGAVYATGANFPDALAAGPLAGRAGAATLLVEDANSPAIPFSAGYRGKVNRAYVVGGENAVSRSTADAIADSLGLKHAQ